MEYRVLDVLKHEFDVLRVYGRGEVVEEGLGALPAAGIEALQQERLHVLDAVRVAGEVGHVVLDADVFDLRLE